MESYRLDDLEITVHKPGADRYTKVSYPIRYGKFSEIKTPEYLFQFNLNGEIKFIRGLKSNWPHPAEWLKLTAANDWVFYSVGGYNEIFSLLGEFYLPCLPYPSNSLWHYNPFADPRIKEALAVWWKLRTHLSAVCQNGAPAGLKQFLTHINRHDAPTLAMKSKNLHRIIGGPVSVLPPDTRHVDYEVIPLMIADGCLYHCDFCCIKTAHTFQPRSTDNIAQQIKALKAFYGADLSNYNALFLGNHDALAAGGELIRWAAEKAHDAFVFDSSNLKGPTLFLFGSVDSLLDADHHLFETLNRGPYYTYINIGIESVDAATLADINKPLETHKIEAAFDKMLSINRNYPRIEITANFLLGGRLRPQHYQSLIQLIRSRIESFCDKGGIYLSPLKTRSNVGGVLRTFIGIKRLSRLPAHLYLIQRL